MTPECPHCRVNDDGEWTCDGDYTSEAEAIVRELANWSDWEANGYGVMGIKLLMDRARAWVARREGEPER